jgi:hypothetical protein
VKEEKIMIRKFVSCTKVDFTLAVDFPFLFQIREKKKNFISSQNIYFAVNLR